MSRIFTIMKLIKKNYEEFKEFHNNIMDDFYNFVYDLSYKHYISPKRESDLIITEATIEDYFNKLREEEQFQILKVLVN